MLNLVVCSLITNEGTNTSGEKIGRQWVSGDPEGFKGKLVRKI